MRYVLPNILSISHVLNLVWHFTWSVSEVVLCVFFQWYSGFSNWYQSECIHCGAVVAMVFLIVSAYLFPWERERRRVREYWKINVGNQYRESVMSNDFYGDTGVDIKACFTPCSRIIWTLKAKGIIPQGVCFILSKSVNIILTNAQNLLALQPSNSL